MLCQKCCPGSSAPTLELHRYRSGAPPPGIPGIRAGARRLFCSTAKKERSLSPSLSLFLDVELPRFTARNSFPISSPSHVPGASQVFPQHVPPTNNF